MNSSSSSKIVTVSSIVQTIPSTPTSVSKPKNHGVHQHSYREIHMQHDWQVRFASPGPNHSDGQNRFAKQSRRRRKRTVTCSTKTMTDVHSDHQPQTPSHKTVLLSSSSPTTMPCSETIQLTQVTPQSRQHPQQYAPPRFDTDGQSAKPNQHTMVSTIRKPFAGGAYFEKSPPAAEHNKREKTWLSRPHHPHRSSAGHVKFEANDTVLCKPCHCVLMDAGQQRPAGYPKPVALIAHETKSGPTRSTPSRQHPHTHRPHLWWHHYHSPHDKPESSSTGSSSLLYTIYGMRPLLSGTHEYSTPWLWNRETGNLTQTVHPVKHRTGFHNHHKRKKNKIQNSNCNEPCDNDQSSSSCCFPRSVSPSSRNRRPPRTPNNQTDGPNGVVSETGDSLSHECYPWFQIRKVAHVLQPFRRADYHRVHNRRARASSCSYTLHILTRCHHHAQQTKFRPMYTAILEDRPTHSQSPPNTTRNHHFLVLDCYTGQAVATMDIATCSPGNSQPLASRCTIRHHNKDPCRSEASRDKTDTHVSSSSSSSSSTRVQLRTRSAKKNAVVLLCLATCLEDQVLDWEYRGSPSGTFTFQ